MKVVSEELKRRASRWPASHTFAIERTVALPMECQIRERLLLDALSV
jgi:hypothetical protein